MRAPWQLAQRPAPAVRRRVRVGLRALALVPRPERQPVLWSAQLVLQVSADSRASQARSEQAPMVSARQAQASPSARREARASSDRHPRRRNRTPRARSNPVRGIPFRPRSCDGGVRHGDRGGANASLHHSLRQPNAGQRAPKRSRQWLRVPGAGRAPRHWLPGHRAGDVRLPAVAAVAACVAAPPADSGAAPRRGRCRAEDAGRGVAAVCCRHRVSARGRAGRANRHAFRRERCRAVAGRCRVPVYHAQRRARVRQASFPARPVCGTSSSCARRNLALAHARVRRRQAPALRAPARDSPARFR